MYLQIGPSPCLGCRRVPNPDDCENKRCAPWRKWFLMRWSMIHAFGKKEDQR